MGFVIKTCLFQGFRQRTRSFPCNVGKLRIMTRFIRVRVRNSYNEANSGRFIACARFYHFSLRLTSFGFKRVFSDFTCMCFLFSNDQAMSTYPFSRDLSLMMSIPRTTIRCADRAFIPIIFLFFDRDSVRCTLCNFTMAFRCHLCMFNASNATFGFRCPRANVRRLISRTSNFRIFETRSMFIICLRLHSHFAIFRSVASPTGLRTNSPINQASNVVRTRMTFTACHRTRDAIARRLSTRQFANKATSILFLSLTMGIHGLIRIRFTYRCSGINGLNVRLRNFNVASIRLNKGVCFLSRLPTMRRNNCVQNSSN